MKRAYVVRLVTVAALVLAFGGLLQASAQQVVVAAKSPVNIRKLSGSTAKTPEYKLLTGQVMARTRDWYVLTTQYETDPDWMDDLTFTYYVLLKGKNSTQPQQTLLSGDVTYVNVQKGKHMSDMYLHPSTLARYGDVQGVAVIVKAQGRVVAMDSKPANPQRWWELLAPLPDQVLNRMQTPFAMVNFDDYEAIKATSGR